jgi:signal transduction histidine kinase/DNA-binding NarL/FixJ family response regulator
MPAKPWILRLFDLLVSRPDTQVPDDDPGYRGFYYAKSKNMMRVSLLTPALIFTGSAALDLFLKSLGYEVSLNPRLFVFIPLLFAEFLVSLTPFFEKHHQEVLMFALGLVANAAGLLHYALPDSGRSVFFYEFNPLILMVFAFTICRLTFKNAIRVSAFIMLSFEIAELAFRRPMSNPEAMSLFISTNRVLASFYLFLMWACLSLENHLKQEYADRIRLAELEKGKSEFFANISHELRTPLTLIVGPVEAIARGDYGPMMSAENPVFQTLSRNGQRLLGLIEQILDFSRLDAGAPARKVRVDLSALLRELIGSMESAARARGLSLAFFDETGGLTARVDPGQTERALLNLVANAMKFTPSGGSIAVRLAREGEGLSISVMDNGIGIAEDRLSSIFERFNRGDEPESRRYQGAGIGLALVKRIAESQGGSVSVSSRIGRGSIFVLLLPIEEGGGAAPSADAISSGMAAGFLASLAEERAAPQPAVAPPGAPVILTIDDSSDMRDFIKASLGTRYRFVEADDGAKGLAAMIANPPDLVLVDIMMPGMDGMDFIRAVRADGARRGLPIMVISARDDAADRLGAIESGALDYLIKPFSARELAARVRAHIESKRLRDDLASQAAALERSEARARELADLAGAGIVEADRDGSILYLNQTARRLLGAGEGAGLFELAATEDRDRLERAAADGRFSEGSPPFLRFKGMTGGDFMAIARLMAMDSAAGGFRLSFLDLEARAGWSLLMDESFLDPYKVTNRERAVVGEMLAGRSIRQIGERLFISEATVKTHQQNIYNKLGISSKKQLFAMARESLLGRLGSEGLACYLLAGLLGDAGDGLK